MMGYLSLYGSIEKSVYCHSCIFKLHLIYNITPCTVYLLQNQQTYQVIYNISARITKIFCNVQLVHTWNPMLEKSYNL